MGRTNSVKQKKKILD